jgi:alpha-1,2-mannosyltransferase
LQLEAELVDAPSPIWRRTLPWSKMLGLASLIVAVLLFVTALTAYLTDAVVHPGLVLNWYDLNVYNDAGLITRQLPSYLYVWQLSSTVKFTYTPFAAVVFAGLSFLSWPALRWLMTLSSLAAIPVAAWLTLGAMGKRGIGRTAMALAVGAVGLWTEPVTKALSLGQVEPLLLLLVVWDLTRPDANRWKGLGIGIAAGIKLVPLLFIPYLLLAGKFRQAVVATATFAITVLVGLAALPGPSLSYWLTGYFIQPGRTGAVDALVNQSLLGMLARLTGSGVAAQPIWLPVTIIVGLVGIAAAAYFNRTGMPAHGWVLVGITSVLVSPISWDHHWVWVVPVLALIGGLIMSARGAALWVFLAAGVGLAALFGSWPLRYSGPQAYVPQRGLIGWFVQPPQSYAVTTLHGWELLTWNLFVLVGLVIYLVMVGSAVLAWRRSRPRPPAALTPGPVDAPIDALIARANAVLRSNAEAQAASRSDAAGAVAGAVPTDDVAVTALPRRGLRCNLAAAIPMIAAAIRMAMPAEIDKPARATLIR